MVKIKKHFLKINYNTLLKYFLSYFFLLSFLLGCFFIIFRNQLKDVYYSERDKSIQEKLLLFQQSFNTDLEHVFNIHYNLTNNMNLKMLSYSPDSTWYSSLCISDMRGFVSANPLLSDIVYIDKYSENILACKNYVYQSGASYYFSTAGKGLKLPVGKYGHEGRNTMVYVQNQELSLLLLFPNVESNRYELFYVIDSDEILARFGNMLSEEISGVRLMDYEDNVIAASGDQRALTGLGRINLLELEARDEKDEIVYTLPLHANLFLAVCFSKEILIRYADRAFLHMYMVVAGIGCAGLLLILFGMWLTYVPLHKLSRKFVDAADDGRSLELALDQAFSSALQEQEKLQEKINKYHNLMKESILDTIVSENGDEITEENMDRLLNGEPGSLMFVVKIAFAVEGEKAIREESFQKFFLKTFPNQDSFCILLEKAEKYASYLIYYGGADQDKYNVLKYLLQDFHKDYGCKIALSNGSSSPLDIPTLYADAMEAARGWESTQVVFYDERALHTVSTESYPYQELSNFALLLGQVKFEEAKEAVMHFFAYLDRAEYPNFYTRSVLTEMLTTIITSMNQQNIRFAAYNNLYFETLYFIRSFAYEQKKDEICVHFLNLINLFEQELANLTIKSGQLQEFVEQSYTSSELSIAGMAERFHVSIAYMSYLFKKYFNENFSDYLWKLRVAKAKTLLRETSMPVEEICLEVGYENVSSFRRKFKKELGITPSQYRSGLEPAEEEEERNRSSL